MVEWRRSLMFGLCKSLDWWSVELLGRSIDCFNYIILTISSMSSSDEVFAWGCCVTACYCAIFFWFGPWDLIYPVCELIFYFWLLLDIHIYDWLWGMPFGEKMGHGYERFFKGFVYICMLMDSCGWGYCFSRYRFLLRLAVFGRVLGSEEEED